MIVRAQAILDATAWVEEFAFDPEGSVQFGEVEGIMGVLPINCSKASPRRVTLWEFTRKAFHFSLKAGIEFSTG